MNVATGGASIEWNHFRFLLNGVNLASYPVPRPAFRRLQYGKAGRAWYIFSRE